MNFLRDLALAHQKHEGYYFLSLSQRNNNSGNLRLTSYQMHLYGAVEGAGGFAKFPSYSIGLRALEDDLRAKITGHSKHIDYSKNPTFLDYVKVYAPSGDNNNPTAYANALIKSLPQYGLNINMPLTQVALLLNKKPLILSVGAKIRALERGIVRATKRGLHGARLILQGTLRRLTNRK